MITKSEKQARLWAKSKMPRPPKENVLVVAIRKALDKMGIPNASGRVPAFKGTHVQYIPILGKGTPDILFWINGNQMHGIEAKRDVRGELRATQEAWKAKWSVIGVKVFGPCSDVRSAVEFAQGLRRAA